LDEVVLDLRVLAARAAARLVSFSWYVCWEGGFLTVFVFLPACASYYINLLVNWFLISLRLRGKLEKLVQVKLETRIN